VVDKKQLPVVALSRGHNKFQRGATRSYKGRHVWEFEIVSNIVKEVEAELKRIKVDKLVYVPDLDFCEKVSRVTMTGTASELMGTIRFINRREVKYAIEVHANTHSNSKVKGVEIFYLRGSMQGRVIAGMIAAAFNEAKVITPVVIKDDTASHVYATTGKHLAFLKYTKMPAVIVECGFMSNDRDMDILVNHPIQIGKAIAKAIQRLILASSTQ